MPLPLPASTVRSDNVCAKETITFLGQLFIDFFSLTFCNSAVFFFMGCLNSFQNNCKIYFREKFVKNFEEQKIEN